MLGLFGLFGRSRELERLNQALRAVGLHPHTVPDAVKLATLRQLKESQGDGAPGPGVCSAAAALLGYCMLGRQAFTECNGATEAEAVEGRLMAAIEAGDSADARLVLLSLHAGVIEAGVVERYQLAVE